MPRTESAVKDNNKFLKRIFTSGVCDIHFHGAFGIDLMSATKSELQELSFKLANNGISSFCPTTLSSDRKTLLKSVTRLGEWICSEHFPGARPLGIHLEGPFINPLAAGAHPKRIIRPATLGELTELWAASQGTIKIITLAPETLTPETLKSIAKFAKERRITLSLGHSTATEEQAHRAKSVGFKGITHAWNALAFHHRAPGPLGAFLGDNSRYLELIIDGEHVAPSVLRWMLEAHQNICFVSDAVPACGTSKGRWRKFGDLDVTLTGNVCRLRNGSLAGGGMLLPQAFVNWFNQESRQRKLDDDNRLKLFKKTVKYLTATPLKAIGSHSSGKAAIHWFLNKTLSYEVVHNPN